MSLSSGATLTTSPVAATHPSLPPATGGAPPNNRRASHGAHHQHSVHAKRRQGSHSHYTHAAPHAGGSAHAGPSRRSSEGEHGRRAMAAGLTMAAMDHNTLPPPGKPRRKGSGDRPLRRNISSRSDTNLPRLSRVPSRASERSSHSRPSSRAGSRNTSPVRPPVKERTQSTQSTDSVELDDEGNPTRAVDPDEEGWEEDEEVRKSSRTQTPRQPPGGLTASGGQDMRRTMSDTHAHSRLRSRAGGAEGARGAPGVLGLGDLGRATSDKLGQAYPGVTRKTTGFAGTTQTPDPTMISSGHALNDPTHIMPAHQIKHQQSARSLHAIQQQQQLEAEGGRRRKDSNRSLSGLSRTDSEGSQKRSDGGTGPAGVKRAESTLSMTKTSGETPSPSGVELQRQQSRAEVEKQPASEYTNATHESNASKKEEDRPNDPSDRREQAEPTPQDPSTSPSYPFPRLQPESSESSDATVQPHQPESSSSDTAAPPSPDHGQRSRQVSSSSTASSASAHIPTSSANTIQPVPRQLRHRYSNSSIRSIQSLRAPPHPLNSPTGYRSGSAHPSPMKGKGPSLHQPPVAPPVVNREAAAGQSWHSPTASVSSDRGIRAKSKPASASASTSTSTATPPDVSGRQLGGVMNPMGQPKMARNSSFSSIRSLTNRIASTTGITSSNTALRTDTSDTASTTTSATPGIRRPTALEAAAAAAKLKSTTDPVAYHASLGFPAASAETAHLISRFLPPPKVRRPAWEISPEAARSGFVGIGLTNGDYRESHEALVRTMRTMGVSGAGGWPGGAGGGTAGGRRGMSRANSYSQSLLQNIGAQAHISGGGGGGSSVGGSQHLTPQTTGVGSRLRPMTSVSATSSVGDRTPVTTPRSGTVALPSLPGGGHVPRQQSLASMDEVGIIRIGGGAGSGGGNSMVVSRGGWEGRTPFELSLERVLAQRPVRSLSGGGGSGFLGVGVTAGGAGAGAGESGVWRG